MTKQRSPRDLAHEHRLIQGLASLSLQLTQFETEQAALAATYETAQMHYYDLRTQLHNLGYADEDLQAFEEAHNTRDPDNPTQSIHARYPALEQASLDDRLTKAYAESKANDDGRRTLRTDLAPENPQP